MNGFRLLATLLVGAATLMVAMPVQAQDEAPSQQEDRLRPGKKLTAPTDQRGGTYRDPGKDKRGDEDIDRARNDTGGDDRNSGNSGTTGGGNSDTADRGRGRTQPAPDRR